jgi:hypothetical protein
MATREATVQGLRRLEDSVREEGAQLGKALRALERRVDEVTTIPRGELRVVLVTDDRGEARSATPAARSVLPTLRRRVPDANPKRTTLSTLVVPAVRSDRGRDGRADTDRS